MAEPTFVDTCNGLGSHFNCQPRPKKVDLSKADSPKEISPKETGTSPLAQKWSIEIKKGDLDNNIKIFNKIGDYVEHGEVDYVITLKGEIKVGIKHFDLADGKEVLGAGSFLFCKGKVIATSNTSGHYSPTPLEAYNSYKLLSEKGIILKNTYDHTLLNIDDYLRQVEFHELRKIWDYQLKFWKDNYDRK